MRSTQYSESYCTESTEGTKGAVCDYPVGVGNIMGAYSP